MKVKTIRTKIGLLTILSLLPLVATTTFANPPTLQGPTFLPGDGARDAASGDQEEVAITAGGGGFWHGDRRAADHGHA